MMRNKRSKESDAQQTFNWTYLQRKAWIDEAVLPRGEAKNGDGVSPQTMRDVLHMINDHLGDNPDAWPSRDRIANSVNIDPKTVTRATQALAKLSLLIVIPEELPGNAHRNRYRIVWTELALLEPSRRAQWLEMVRGRSRPGDMVSRPGDMVSRPGDMVSRPGDMVSRPGDTMSRKQLTNNSLNNPKNNPPLQTRPSSDRAADGGGTDWGVVVSALLKVGVDDAAGAVRVAQQRGLTAAEVDGLVERFMQLTAVNPKADAGWLHRWVTGKSRPPSAMERPVKPARASSLTSDTTRREMIRSRIVSAGRRAGASEEAIEQRVGAALAALATNP